MSSVRWEEGGRNKGKRGWEPMVIPLLSLYRFQWPYVPCIYVHPITNIIGQKKSELHLPPQGFYSANFLNAGIVYMLTLFKSGELSNTPRYIGTFIFMLDSRVTEVTAGRGQFCSPAESPAEVNGDA
jgi:hypothetical protein